MVELTKAGAARYSIKHVRDRAKSRYEKGPACEICGEVESLDFHHFQSLSPLLRKWRLKNKVLDADVLLWRDIFIQEHEAELYEHAVTICSFHHQQLHSIYGKAPTLGTWLKQKRWVEIQKEKHGLVQS